MVQLILNKRRMQHIYHKSDQNLPISELYRQCGIKRDPITRTTISPVPIYWLSLKFPFAKYCELLNSVKKSQQHFPNNFGEKSP